MCWSSGRTASGTSCWPGRPCGRWPRGRSGSRSCAGRGGGRRRRCRPGGGGRVALLWGPGGGGAAGLLPGVDGVVAAHASWIDAAPERVTRAGVDSLVDRLVGLEIDQAVVLPSFHQSPLPLALLLRMAGVPTIAAISVDYPGSLLDVRHRVDEDLHEVE